MSLNVQLDARIEETIHHIGSEVGAEDDAHGDHDDGLRQQEVAPFNGGDEQAPQPGKAEHKFNDDQAADQPADADGDDSDGRQEGVSQDMPQNHSAVGDALEHSGADIIALEFFDDAGACQARNVSQQNQGGGSCSQISPILRGQRVWKRQPPGKFWALGRLSLNRMRAVRRLESAIGMAETKASV